MRKKSTRNALLKSALALLLCFSMLIGSTYAWFTDEVTSSGNIIQSGNLDIDMQWAEKYEGDATVWNDAAGENAKPVFDYQNWEPGYTEVRYIKVSNEGNLAFKWLMNIIPVGEVGKLAEVIDVRFDVVTDNPHFAAPTAEDKQGTLRTAGALSDVIAGDETVVQGVLLPEGEEKADFYSGEVIACISLHMREDAGNEYQDEKIGDSFNIRLQATQYNYEIDDFGSDYDKEATYPHIVTNLKLSADIAGKVEDGKLTEKVELKDGATGITATVPVGTSVDANTLVLKITEDDVDKNITLGQTVGYDVVVEGVAMNNNAPVIITMPKAMPKGQTAVQLYHAGKAMTRVYTVEALSQKEGDNDTYGDKFLYDEKTGDVSFSLIHFSNVSMGTDNKVVVKGVTYSNVIVKDLATETGATLTIPADGNVYVINHTRTDTTTKNALDLTLTHTWHNINPGTMSSTALKVEKGAKVVLNGVNIRTGAADALQIIPSNKGAKTEIMIADGTSNWLTGVSGIGFGSYVYADVYIEGYGCLYATAMSWGSPGIGVDAHTEGDGNKLHLNVRVLRAIPRQTAAGIGGGFANQSWRGLALVEINGGKIQSYSGGDAAAIGCGLNGHFGEIVINDGDVYCYNQPWTAYWATMGHGAYAGSCTGIYVSKDAYVNQWARSTPMKTYASEVVKGFEPMSGLTVSGASMYSVGDEITVDSITVGYRDVADKVLTSGYTVGSVDMTTGGKKNVTVSYKENGNTVTGTYSFTVKDAYNALIASPKKNIYEVNSTLTIADFNVSALASDGTKGTISTFDISGADTSTVGTKIVTISYTNSVTGKTISTTCQISVVNTTITNHNQYWFDPYIFYLGDNTLKFYKSYTTDDNDPFANRNTFPYLGEYIGANGEKATGFFNWFGECQYPVDSPSGWYVQMGQGQYGLNITDALPWTTIGAGYVTSYDTPVVGVGYYIDGDVSTLKYNQPDYFKDHASDPNYNGFITQYGIDGFASNTKLKLSDFEAGSKHTVTWIVVFEDGIQKISDWTITMKSSFGDDNYFKDTDKPNVNVVVLSGQSNAAGATVITQSDIDKYSSVDYSNVYIQYKNVSTADGINVVTQNENGGFEKYAFGIGGYTDAMFGPEAALAYHLATTEGLKNQQWFIVKYAAPGTNLDLHWRQNANLSQKMMDFVQGCVNTLDKDYDVRIRSFLWMQGENDALAESCANNYAVNEQNLVSQFRLKFAKYASRPNGSVPGSGIGFITAGIAPAGKDGLSLWQYSSVVNAAKVNNAQIWYVPGTLTEYSALYGLVATSGRHNNPGGAIYNSAYIDTSLMSTQAHDTAHYDQQSMDWLGTWFGQYVAVLMAEE